MVGSFQQRLYSRQSANSRQEHVPMLLKNRPQGVHKIGALVDEPFPVSKQDCLGLLLSSFGKGVAHFRLASSNCNRLGIACIILLPLDEGSNILLGYQPRFMTKFLHFARPVARTAASLKHNYADRLLLYELPDLFPRLESRRHQ